MKFCIFVIDELSNKILSTVVTDSSTFYLTSRCVVNNQYNIINIKVDKSELCHTTEYRVLT